MSYCSGLICFWVFRSQECAAVMEVRTRSARWPFTGAKCARSVLMCLWECVFCKRTRPAHRECINGSYALVILLFLSLLTVTLHRPSPPPSSSSSLPKPPTVLSCFMGHTWYKKKKKMYNGWGEAEINVLISNHTPVFDLKVPQSSMKTPQKREVLYWIGYVCVRKVTCLGKIDAFFFCSIGIYNTFCDIY